MMLSRIDKQALLVWEEYRANILKSTPVDLNETPKQKIDRIKRLEANQLEWHKYYFPNYCDAEFAPFQKKASNITINNILVYLVKAWSRELAKSSTSMMDELFMLLTGKMKNMLIVSHSKDNAVELAKPTLINLESNERLNNDYGIQRGLKTWDYTSGKWMLNNGAVIRAIGMGESPRGSKNEEKRIDYIRFDDCDTDEKCRNQKRVENDWKWIEQACFPAMSIIGSRRIVFCGNIISKNSLITKAISTCKSNEERKDAKTVFYYKVVNIRDANGNPSWGRYTNEDIDEMLSTMSYVSQQKEYFNNPITEGTVFDKINHKKLPPLSSYAFLVAYGDPSWKDSKKNDYKAIPLVGYKDGEYHVRKAFVRQCSSAKMAEGYNMHKEFVSGKTNIYYVMEAILNQDRILNEVNAYIFSQNWGFSILGDYEQKGDKFSRIETTLDPLHSQNKLFFDIDQIDDPDMKVAEAQMLALEPSLSSPDDFPDALAAAVNYIKKRISSMVPPTFGKYTKNKGKHY